MSRVAARNCVQILEYEQEAIDVFGSPPVHHVKVPCRVRHALENGRSHADDNDFDSRVSEAQEYFVKLGFGCHGGF